ncbi:hypothetical protein KOW79_006171 [Hemibagrus wyckioides]|uniref:Uncharacterized protein n=1 Tax=Hemibagrus wyckioides TaxID=337641 RepID=A0A9D3NWN7_9TELE|nr:hypothetical protein KOW79_006171 [Hemibagrus wyckioides]
MKGAVLILLLLIALFQSSSLAGPMDRLQLTLQPEIQTEALETGPLDESQNGIAQSVGVRLRRETPIISKTPERFCPGCFSVIGDPTRPQQ